MSDKFISLDGLPAIKAHIEEGLSGKIDCVPGAAQYNTPIFDDNGMLVDSGLNINQKASVRSWINGDNDFGAYVEQFPGSENYEGIGLNVTHEDMVALNVQRGNTPKSVAIPTTRVTGRLQTQIDEKAYMTAGAGGNDIGIGRDIDESRLALSKNGDFIDVNITGKDGAQTQTTLPNKDYVDGIVPTVDQTYDGTSANAQSGVAIQTQVDNLQTQIDGLGEPFRVKQWTSNTLNVTIPCCTTDIGNTQIAKMTFAIDAEEGAEFQIVGMIAYEVFDAASGGSRINCWPVCQFTGNGQKELGVRWMCGGTTDKVAKRISAWVLLKHR